MTKGRRGDGRAHEGVLPACLLLQVLCMGEMHQMEINSPQGHFLLKICGCEPGICAHTKIYCQRALVRAWAARRARWRTRRSCGREFLSRAGSSAAASPYGAAKKGSFGRQSIKVRTDCAGPLVATGMEGCSRLARPSA